MKHLCLALYTEGPTDDLFLPTIIDRTAQEIVAGTAGEMVQVLPIFPANPKGEPPSGSIGERIRIAAQRASNQHILVVHQDTDKQSRDEAIQTRFDPGVELVNKIPEEESACRALVPLFPQRMIEAWMLSDVPAVLAAIGTNKTVSELRNDLRLRQIKLPKTPTEIEACSDPKWVIEQIVNVTKERRKVRIGDLYEPLGRNMDLKKLSGLESYQHFTFDLRTQLLELRILEP